MRTLAAPVTFTTQQLARLAFSLTPEILVPHDFRMLRKPISGQDRPQLVLWGADHQHLRTLPVAHPDLAAGFCTIAVDSPLSPLQIILEVGRACGTPSADRHSLLKGQSSLQLDSITQDPLRSQDLRRFDHASFQRSPVPGSIVASMLSPAVDHPNRPASGEAPHPDGTWLPASPTLTDQHGIIDVFVDTASIGVDLHEFIVHSLGCGPRRYWISSFRTPADATRIITAGLRRTEATVLWPQDAPCLPGLPIHAVVLPTATPAHQHFALVDARRVFPTGGASFWPIPIPSPLRVDSIVPHALDGRQICITPSCATVDGIRRHRDFSPNSRISTITLHAEGSTGRNCIFGNTEALFDLPGFRQEVMRLPALTEVHSPLTSTTSTTGVALPAFPRSTDMGIISSPGNIDVVPVHFFASCGNCRPVEIIVERSATIESVLTTACMRLLSRTRLPSRADFLLSKRLHWLGHGEAALFLTSGWGTFEPREVEVWIDAFPLWASPYLTLVPNFADKDELLTRIHIPGVKDLHVAVDGILWNGEGRFFYNGVVIQFRPLPLQLATLPVHSVQERIEGICAAQIGCEGPNLSTWTHAPEAWHAAFAEHFHAWATAFRDAYEPTPQYNTVYLVVQAGPCLRLSLRTPLAPSLDRVQQAFDELLPTHGPRQVEDTKFVWDDCCIYIARRADFPTSMWFVLNGPTFDVLQLDSKESLADVPAPTGYCWYPQETRGNVGIAICRPSRLPPPARCRGRLDALDERPPFVLGSALNAYDLFGSSSEGPSVAASATSSTSSSISSSDTSPEPPSNPVASSSVGVSLLQKEVILRPTQPQRRSVPTPCRSRLSAPSAGACDQHVTSQASELTTAIDAAESARLQCPESHNQQMLRPPLSVGSATALPEATLLSIHGALDTQPTSESEQLRILHCRLSAPWFHTWQHSLPALRLPAWLRTLVNSPRPPGPVIAVHVYTDGSAKPGFAGGWAAVLVDEVLTPAGSAYCYAAYMSGNMRDFQLTPLCESADNIAAEHAAAVMASAWMLSAPDGLPVHIWADCEGAVHAANGSQKPAGSGKHRLGECLRILQQAHESRPAYEPFAGPRATLAMPSMSLLMLWLTQPGSKGRPRAFRTPSSPCSAIPPSHGCGYSMAVLRYQVWPS